MQLVLRDISGNEKSQVLPILKFALGHLSFNPLKKIIWFRTNKEHQASILRLCAKPLNRNHCMSGTSQWQHVHQVGMW